MPCKRNWDFLSVNTYGGPYNCLHYDFFFFRVCPLVDPASMAYVQTESSSLAASFTRDQRGAQPKTSGKSQEEEAQITQNHPCLAVNTSFLYWRLF